MKSKGGNLVAGDKVVFVTGGAGVIGLQLVPLLVSAGHKVVVADLKNRPMSFGPEIHYIKGDLNQFNEEHFSKLNIQILIHLAATFERSQESWGFYTDNFDNNIRLSNHVMRIARKSKLLERVLFASSYLVYKKDQYIFSFIPETPIKLGPPSALGPRNLIGASKLLHESELSFISKFDMTNFSIVIPRIYRGYGLGSRDIISRWIRLALNNSSLIAYDIEGIFDYIYCKDSAMGIFKLACESDYSGILDLGTGHPRKVKDVLDVILHHFPDTRVENGLSTGLYEASRASTEVLQSATNWLPQYNLETAIPEIIEFELSQRVI
jgi:carbamoyl-phosphate synthase large subunit